MEQSRSYPKSERKMSWKYKCVVKRESSTPLSPVPTLLTSSWSEWQTNRIITRWEMKTNLRKFEIGVELVASGGGGGSGKSERPEGIKRREDAREAAMASRWPCEGWRGTLGWRRRARGELLLSVEQRTAMNPRRLRCTAESRITRVKCNDAFTADACLRTLSCVCVHTRARVCVRTPSVTPGVHDTANVIQMMNNSWTNDVKGWIVLATRDSVQLAFNIRTL